MKKSTFVISGILGAAAAVGYQAFTAFKNKKLSELEQEQKEVIDISPEKDDIVQE